MLSKEMLDKIEEAGQRLGFSNYRPGQRKVVEAFMEGNNVLAVMPTGGGKSLTAHVLPYLLGGTVVVVTPTIALMRDQVLGLKMRGINAEYVNSDNTFMENRLILEELGRGELELVFMGPEKLVNAEVIAAVGKTKIKALVVDECHLIEDWSSFRPNFLYIHQFRKLVGLPPVLALTATATPELQEVIVDSLCMWGTEDRKENMVKLVSGFDRKNLKLEIHPTNYSNRTAQLVELLGRVEIGASIVYLPTKNGVEQLWRGLGAFVNDERLCMYHGGLPGKEKALQQDKFMRSLNPVMIATKAFGLGIDRKDVRQVIHYMPPGNMESYYQEVGRAGRDGLPATCTVMFNKRNSREEMSVHHFFIEKEFLKVPDYAKLMLGVKNMSDIELKKNAEQLGWLYRARLLTIASERKGLPKKWLPVSDWNNSILHARLTESKFERKSDIRKVEDFLSGRRCLRKFILEHFDDVGNDGGNTDARDFCCSVCDSE